ncbi:DUF1906 domain-containing protein [Corynebacterium ulceribovis]|uniref:DUF1906 domain-containing protein n=1 Tax=Corynebacterium ulceribovis TaxID=487732 RepID=UPI00035F3FE1|nr:DUF1906 domain-containing protein [Corynebacterium ulceribovis]
MTQNARTFSRRSILSAVAIGTGAAATTAALPVPKAHAAPVLGTVIDFSAGVPAASAVKNAGHIGAVRYVSQRRPGADWMKGKPVTLAETKAMANLGLQTASVYQFGRANTADWLTGAKGAATHVPQAIALHMAAGGPTGRPIYMAIDDNPTRAQYTNQVKPYLQACQVALKAAGYSMGVYGNYNTIQWCIQDGLGSFFWQHDWGSQGKLHPRASIHQKAGYRATISGVEVDVNNVYTRDWGQWKPGATGSKVVPVDVPTTTPQPKPVQQKPAQQSQPAQQNQQATNGQAPTLSSMIPLPPELKKLGIPTLNGNALPNMQQIQQAIKVLAQILKYVR